MPDFTALAPNLANTTLAGDQFRPEIATLANGNYLVVWTTAVGPPSTTQPPQFAVYGQLYGPAGTRIDGEVLVYDGASAAAVSALADGTFVVALTTSVASGNTAMVQHLDASGHPIGAPTVLATQDGLVFPVADDVDALPAGGWVATYHLQHPGVPWIQEDIFAQRFDASGVKTGDPVFVESGFSGTASTSVLLQGDWVTTWGELLNFGPNGLGSFAEQFSPTGALLLARSLEPDPLNTEITPVNATLESGNYVIAWHAGNGDPGPERLQMQLFAPDGSPVSGVIEYDAPESVGPVMPQLTALADGGFLLSFEDSQLRPAEPVTGYSTRVLGQYFDAAGQASGPLMELVPAQELSFGAQVSWSISPTVDGGFVVASARVDASTGNDVYVQQFEPALAGQSISGGNGGDALSGTPGNDTIDGGNGKDTITGGAGNDLLLGGNGVDTAVFSGPIANYTITQTDSGFTVADRTGANGIDTLVDMERVQFADARVALDVHGSAGMAWRLYQAAFNREPDLPGLGYQMSAMDNGLTLQQVARHFLESPEFQSTYGALGNEQFVAQLYQNVLHRAPDAGGFEYHTSHLEAGVPRWDVLAGFSESPENQVNVVGAIAGGMLYVV